MMYTQAQLSELYTYYLDGFITALSSRDQLRSPTPHGYAQFAAVAAGYADARSERPEPATFAVFSAAIEAMCNPRQMTHGEAVYFCSALIEHDHGVLAQGLTYLQSKLDEREPGRWIVHGSLASWSLSANF